jgi:hypothetical protein
MRPPAGDPEANSNKYWLLQKTLYGFCCSPRHCYNMIDRILKSNGLEPSLEDRCLFTGFLKDLDDPTSVPSSAPLSLGLYVDKIVYFLEDPAVDALFCYLFSAQCKATSWALLNGFLTFTSPGGLLHCCLVSSQPVGLCCQPCGAILLGILQFHTNGYSLLLRDLN